MAEAADGLVRQLVAITGPAAVAVHGGGAALLHALRDATIEAVPVDEPGALAPPAAILLLAAPALSAEAVAPWLAAAPDIVAIAGIAGARMVALDDMARRLGWSRHPRSFRAPGLIVLRRASAREDADTADTPRIYDLIANFVRAGDRVGGIGMTATGRDILNANSLADDVTAIPAGEMPPTPESTPADLGCLIVHLAALEGATDRAGFAAMIGGRVEAGGRLILIGDGDHVVGVRTIAGHLASGFIAERSFAIVGGVIVEQDVGEDKRDGAGAGTAILVLMRDPLAPGAPPTDRSFFVPDDPAFHVASFARDYDHPALVKAIVVRGMRLSTRSVLVRTIRRLLPQTAPGGPDRGALLCTLAYQLLLEDAPEPLPAMLADIAEWIAAQRQPQGHRLRWLVSLTSVKMRIERRLGRFDAALATAEACAAIDPVPFSPLLASRTIEALFTAASIRLVRGQTDEAVRLLDRAIPMVRDALGGDWLNIVGDPAHPLPFGLYETAQLVGIASRCVALRAYIDRFPQRPGMVWAQALVLSGENEVPAPSMAVGGGPHAPAQVREFADEFYRLTQQTGQTMAAELARTQALLEERDTQLAQAKAEAAALAPLVETLRQRQRDDRARMAMMRVEALARKHEAEANAAEAARYRAAEESARKAARAARRDAWDARRRLGDTFERLADAERRAGLAGAMPPGKG